MVFKWSGEYRMSTLSFSGLTVISAGFGIFIANITNIVTNNIVPNTGIHVFILLICFLSAQNANAVGAPSKATAYISIETSHLGCKYPRIAIKRKNAVITRAPFLIRSSFSLISSSTLTLVFSCAMAVKRHARLIPIKVKNNSISLTSLTNNQYGLYHSIG